MKPFLLSSVLLVLFVGQAIAGSVTALVDKSSGTVDDEFIFQVTISGSPKDEPVIPDIKGLTIRRVGQSSRTSASIGSITREVEYRYLVTASDVGSYVIPSLTVEVDGKKEKTSPITLTVRDAASGTATNGNNGNEEEGRPVFVRRTVSAKEVYVGEAVVVDTRIYSSGAMTNIAGGYDAPKEWRRFEKDRENAPTGTETINGKLYATVDINEALVPLKAGQLRIPASLFEVTYRGANERRGSEVDDFFGFSFRNRLAQKRVRSQSESVKVKPLPKLESGKQFSGLVGNFHIIAELSHRDVTVGDSVTANITISGEGFIDETFDKLTLPAHDAFKMYPDKPQSEITIDVDGIKSKKVFKIALVPTVAGDINLGDIELTVFNPKLGLYADISANLGKMNVKGSSAVLSEIERSQTPTTATTPVVNQVDDLVALKAMHDIEGSFLEKVNSIGLKFLFSFPVLMLLVGLGRRYTKDYLQKTEGVRLRSSAIKKVRLRLQMLNSVKSAEEIMDVLQELFGARTGGKSDALTLEDFLHALKERKLSAHLIAQTESLYSKLERSIFAGVSLSQKELEDMKQSLRHLADDLAKEWNA